MRGITEVIYVVSGMGKTPAATNRKTGVVYINLEKWKYIKPEHKLYILLHELGHIYHDTSDEFLADQFAFEKYTEMGYSLTEAVFALSKVLTLTQDEHFDRIESQLIRALNYDAEVNENEKAENILNKISVDNLDNFKGKGKFKKLAKKAAVVLPPVAAARGVKAVVKNRKKIGSALRKAAVVLPPVAAARGGKAVIAGVKKRKARKAIVATPSVSIGSGESETSEDTRFVNPYTVPGPDPEPENDNEPDQPEEDVDYAEEEVDVIEDDSTDEFLKKVGSAIKKAGKKVGDNFAPLADIGLTKLPGGNALVAIRKGIVSNSKNKKAQTPTPTVPVGQGSVAEASKPVEQADENKNKMIVVAAVVAAVLLVIVLIVMNKKK